MKLVRFVIVLLFLGSIAIAQEKMPPRVVRVVGTSEVKVAPEARRILADLHANGIAEKDMQTTFLSLQPQFNYRKGMKISYFVASQTLTVTLRDLSRLDAVVESLIKAGANRVDSIEYENSDLRKYRDQARDLAVKAAQEKAQALAHALGQEVGKAYSIEEVAEAASPYSGGLMSNSFYEYRDKAKPAGPTTAAGQNKISASVVVSFDLN